MTVAVAVPPTLDSALTAVTCLAGPGFTVSVQAPKALAVTAPRRVAARPGVTSYSTTVAEAAAVEPATLEVPANVMSFFSRCRAVVMVTTSFSPTGAAAGEGAGAGGDATDDVAGVVVTGAATSAGWVVSDTGTSAGADWAGAG